MVELTDLQKSKLVDVASSLIRFPNDDPDVVVLIEAGLVTPSIEGALVTGLGLEMAYQLDPELRLVI